MFSDKLTNLKDKAVYATYMDAQLAESFGNEMSELCKESFYMVNFLRPDVYDEEGILVEDAPKLYEPGGTLEDVRPFVQTFLEKYNTDFPQKKMELVLFNGNAERFRFISWSRW